LDLLHHVGYPHRYLFPQEVEARLDVRRSAKVDKILHGDSGGLVAGELQQQVVQAFLGVLAAGGGVDRRRRGEGALLLLLLLLTTAVMMMPSGGGRGGLEGGALGRGKHQIGRG